MLQLLSSIRISFLSLVLISSGFAPLALAQSFDRPDGFISSEDIAKMPLEDLRKFQLSHNEALVNLKFVNDRRAPLPPKSVETGHIYALSKYQTDEAVAALLATIRKELARTGSADIPADFQVLMTAIQTLGTIGTSSPHVYLESMIQFAAEIDAKSDYIQGGPVLVRGIDDAITAMAARNYSLVNVEDQIAKLDDLAKNPEVRLKKAEEILNAEIIGQPEVITGFTELLWRSAFYGKKRTKPDVIWLAGQPGTGKNTSVKALADAVNGRTGADLEHVFHVPILRTRSDLWGVMGSTAGHVNSDSFPPILDFLVRHSGGRYMLQQVEPKKPVFAVVENPAYKGETLPGYSSPEQGILFFDEFHNWSRQNKDTLVKLAMEKGYFAINNPNGGLQQIFVPVVFAIATNDGIGLISARENNGQRFGKQMTFERMEDRWDKVHNNKPAIRNEILSGNGARNQTGRDENAPGTSEEFLNRIPDENIFLLRPISPENLQKIAQRDLKEVAEVAEVSDLIPGAQLTWSDEMPKLVQSYDYVPEENARPIPARVKSLLLTPLISAIRAGLLPKKPGLVIHVDTELNPNGSRNLVIEYMDGEKVETIHQLMAVTAKDIARPEITDARIDELLKVPEILKSRVFGADPIHDKLGQSILRIENDANGKADRPATILMFNGLTSTGKTQTAKELNLILTGSSDELTTFDFSQMKTLKSFQERILGLRDDSGNPIPSDFMKAYDRANGHLVVTLDEVPNANPEFLTTLYDIFREGTVTTFSDGKPRPMGGVIFIVTGNPGQEIYHAVPKGLPMEVQMMAWAQMAEKLNHSTDAQRAILQRYYPSPLIARVGMENIYFLPPHDYRSLRQLAQLKLSEALDQLAITNGQRGWKVTFPSPEEYAAFVTMIVDEGFKLADQGASIDSFIKTSFSQPLKYSLLKNKVPTGSTVVLRFNHWTPNNKRNAPGFINYDILVANQDPIPFAVSRPYVEPSLPASPDDQLLTAYHEAGHEIVRRALFGDAYGDGSISIIPGVTEIGGQWIYYQGLASSEEKKSLPNSREYFVRQIAIFMGGETAERFVTRGDVNTAGMRNDIERASALARNAIVNYGLSPTWGLQSVPSGVTTEAYIAGLSDAQKQLLSQEVDKLLNEGRTLAQDAVLANYDGLFLKLGSVLAEKGFLNAEDMEKIYATQPVVDPTHLSDPEREKLRERTKSAAWTEPASNALMTEFKSFVPKPSKPANLDEIALKRKLDAFATVPLPETLPIATKPLGPLSCEGVFTKK